MIPGMFLKAVDGGDVAGRYPAHLGAVDDLLRFTPFPVLVVCDDADMFT